LAGQAEQEEMRCVKSTWTFLDNTPVCISFGWAKLVTSPPQWFVQTEKRCVRFSVRSGFESIQRSIFTLSNLSSSAAKFLAATTARTMFYWHDLQDKQRLQKFHTKPGGGLTQ
jgi:hypothetical protein